MVKAMSGVVIGSGYYSIPTLVLARRCSFVFTTLVYKFMQILVLAISNFVSKTRLTRRGGSPIGTDGHYILDLMPARHSRERRTPGYFIGRLVGGGYSIPTIALANISQLVMNTLTEFSSNHCLQGGLRLVFLPVLGLTQLQARPPDGEEDRQDPPDTVVQNHYIFDLRPQYGSDIIEMFYDVLENNWPASMVAHFRKHRFLMFGWRPKLVKNKKRTKKSLRPTTKGTNRQSPKIQSSSLRSIDINNNSFSHSIEEQVGIQMSTQKGDQGSDVMEKFDLELPIQVTDEDTDIKVPMFERPTHVTCI